MNSPPTPTFPLNRKGIPSKYKKPKERRKETGAWVKSVREALGDSQPAFAARLTKLAIIDRSPNLTSVWSVVSWEKGRREPDEARRKLIEKLAKQVERERNARQEESPASLAG